MIDLNLGYIVLYVDDVDEVREWYETRLDLSRVEERDDAAVMAGSNGFAIEFHKGTPLDHPERVELAFTSPDPDVTFERWRKNGMAVGSKDTEFGRRVISIQDPAGHTVKIFKVDEDKNVDEMTVERRETDEG